MARKVDEIRVGELPGPEPSPVASTAGGGAAHPLTAAWNLALNAALVVREHKVTILPSDFIKRLRGDQWRCSLLRLM